jgi:hypothetical protein
MPAALPLCLPRNTVPANTPTRFVGKLVAVYSVKMDPLLLIRDRRVVTQFDPESYLRHKAEELLADPVEDRRTDSLSLASAASALIAVGVLSAQRAESVLDEFELAWDVEFARCRPGWAPASTTVGYISLDRLADARVVSLGDELMLAAGTLRLRYAVLERDHTALIADFHVRDTPTGLHEWIRVPSGMPSGLTRPELADEFGTSRPLEFNGHGNDDRWSGQFFTDTAIPMDASWIELYGARVELNRPPIPTVVTIESVQSQNTAQMHLLRVLASGDPFCSQDPRAASDALLAAGVIASNDPVLAQINAALTDKPQHRRALAQPKKLNGLPGPWPAPRAEEIEGPDKMIVTGVTTDEFDGHRVAVLAIRSHPDGFIVEAEVTLVDRERSMLEDQELIWWARDDRDQSYLGGWDGSGRQDMSGELKFFPPLDPKAARLELMPTAPTIRAVISVPLT